MLKVNGIVSPKFKRYIIYNCLSNIVCGIETTMSTYSMYTASGFVSEKEIDIYSILSNMIMKDSIGQIAFIPVIPIMTSLSKYGDLKPLKFLGINIGIFEISTLIEHSTPLVSSYLFIPVAGIANIGKIIGLTGLSSFNIGMINKISKDNIIEMSSKISISSTITFGIGSMIGLSIIKLIPNYEIRLGMIIPLSILRYWLIKQSVKGLI